MVSAENEGKLKICPYWRNYTVFGDYAIALCGAKSINERPLVNNDGGRVSVCPLGWGVEKAYQLPAILRFCKLDGLWKEDRNHAIVTSLSGEDGIRCLEELWSEEVERFRKEVANP